MPRKQRASAGNELETLIPQIGFTSLLLVITAPIETISILLILFIGWIIRLGCIEGTQAKRIETMTSTQGTGIWFVQFVG